MDKIKEHYTQLIQEYRQIFVSVLNAMHGEINSLKHEEIKNYLDVEVEKHIQLQRELVKEKRKQFNCKMCGACCRLAISEFSPTQLLEKASRGDKFAKEFISTFSPYNDVSEAEKQFKLYVELLKESGEQVYYYYCKKVTEDNRCSDYENRPAICRDYPDNPIQMLHPTCAFIGWHESIQTIVLTIKAMSEIREHFRKELEKGNL
ncbi:YkgJ family cysteine cluster protein [bacterium]|nr:YkgJ family cysteine cluster protein [bacterium]